MPSQCILVSGRIYDGTDPRLQLELARIYDGAERPRCMCVRGGVEMYLARHRHFVVKRLPDTGSRHHPACPHFEPDPATSGLAALIGKSVIEHAPDRVELRVRFPLSRVNGRPPLRGAQPSPASEVRASRHRMSLLAVLHYLYERAGLNRWYPAMEGTRNQGVLHKYLTAAADEVIVKGIKLSELLYVPEPFFAERKQEIAQRRREKLSLLHAPQADAQFRMGLVLGEFKDSEASTFGRKVYVKHMPDAPLLIDRKAWDRAERTYGALLEARMADIEPKPRLLLAALIHAKREGTYQIDTLAMMLTSHNYLPIDGVHEIALIERLCAGRRPFLKPLRYDARNAVAFANALLLDATGDDGKPLALHVVSPFADPKQRAIREKTAASGGDAVWVWHSDKEMPALPPPG